MRMITVDASELKEEIDSLSNFLKLRTDMSIDCKGGKLVLQSGNRMVCGRDVKTYVKRFLHKRGLSEFYRATEEKDTIRITRKKHERRRLSDRKGINPSSYQTVPYFFPNHP